MAFSHMHAVRFLVSGGYFLDLDGNTLGSLPQQAGSCVRELLNDSIFCKLMCMESLSTLVSVLLS